MCTHSKGAKTWLPWGELACLRTLCRLEGFLLALTLCTPRGTLNWRPFFLQKKALVCVGAHCKFLSFHHHHAYPHHRSLICSFLFTKPVWCLQAYKNLSNHPPPPPQITKRSKKRLPRKTLNRHQVSGLELLLVVTLFLSLHIHDHKSSLHLQ